MIVFLLYIASLLIYLYAFMYQRTTLKIARNFTPYYVAVTQLSLTPKWVGALGWVGAIGSLISLGLVWLNFGFLATIGALIINLLIMVLTPIPYGYFFDKVDKYLQGEINTLKGKQKEDIKFLRQSVLKLKMGVGI